MYFFERSNSQTNCISSSGSGNSTGTDGSGAVQLTSQRKARSVDRIPRLPDKDGLIQPPPTARTRATWRVPNRRASDLVRNSRGPNVNGKSYRTRSDGEADNVS